MMVFEIFWFCQNLRLRQPFESGYPKKSLSRQLFLKLGPQMIFFDIFSSKNIHFVLGFLMGTEMFEIWPNLFPWQCWLTDFHRFWASIQITISQAGMEFQKITSLELIVLSALGKVHQQLRKLRMEAKTVKSIKKMEWCQKLLKSAKSCHYFEPL